MASLGLEIANLADGAVGRHDDGPAVQRPRQECRRDSTGGPIRPSTPASRPANSAALSADSAPQPHRCRDCAAIDEHRHRVALGESGARHARCGRPRSQPQVAGPPHRPGGRESWPFLRECIRGEHDKRRAGQALESADAHVERQAPDGGETPSRRSTACSAVVLDRIIRVLSEQVTPIAGLTLYLARKL